LNVTISGVEARSTTLVVKVAFYGAVVE